MYTDAKTQSENLKKSLKRKSESLIWIKLEKIIYVIVANFLSSLSLKERRLVFDEIKLKHVREIKIPSTFGGGREKKKINKKWEKKKVTGNERKEWLSFQQN